MLKRKVFYAGDSPAGGPANYLLSILRSLQVDVTHISPGNKIPRSALKESFDLYIFSDYGYADLDEKSEKKICYDIRELKSAFLMIGGWGSFSGNFGTWHGSELAKLLPVKLSKADDRLNFASGLYLKKLKKHEVVDGLDWIPSPVICGLNKVKAKVGATELISALPLIHSPKKIAFAEKGYPLLVVDEIHESRRAALTCDLAPHWAGGWVDWGKKRLQMPVDDHIKVEIGDQYVLFGQKLIRWLLKS